MIVSVTPPPSSSAIPSRVRNNSEGKQRSIRWNCNKLLPIGNIKNSPFLACSRSQTLYVVVFKGTARKNLWLVRNRQVSTEIFQAIFIARRRKFTSHISGNSSRSIECDGKGIPVNQIFLHLNKLKINVSCCRPILVFNTEINKTQIISKIQNWIKNWPRNCRFFSL